LLNKGFRIGVDFEDWFSEDLMPEARRRRPILALAAVEKFLLKHATYCQTTTRVMAKAMSMKAKAERIPLAIPNVFPWSDRAHIEQHKSDERGDEVSFYWVSQTIGPGRGLEVLAQALRKIEGHWRLRLRGELGQNAGWFDTTFPSQIRNRIQLLEPVTNKELLARNASHDVGLALELPYLPNKDLTASNKIFDYLRAGLAVIATNTAGQTEVMSTCPDTGWVVPAENVDALATALQQAVDNPHKLAIRKRAALSAAQEHWSWEHYEHSLVAMVNKALEE
jgi:glycosyltransferase involved in cell wall biosynthesis